MKKQVKPAPKKNKTGSAGLKEKPALPAGNKNAAAVKTARTTRKREKNGSDKSFPIVGIGASAGGLEALELFFKDMPAKSGMAFVVVQHLDPTHKGIMAELLQRATPMPVVQIRDRMKVKADYVYLIPPNRDLSILRGTLHLLEQKKTQGLRLPIDFFLRSLADDLQERSIGVILSGMGSDGTLGLRAIKEKGGAAFVQSVESAKFDGMPRSAVDAGLADVVAPVAELPERIIAYVQHPLLINRTDQVMEEKVQSGMVKILILLRSRTGHDFSMYKKNTVYRRIERRMGIHKIHRIGDYVRYLMENKQETELLFRELLIGVTSFFRDIKAWEQLRERIIPEILAARPEGGIIRAWTPGCSTGEEAYSLAIVFREALEKINPDGSYSFQIFATDLDKDAIEKARAAVYPANITADVSAQRLKRFFVQEDRSYRVAKEIREMVIFAPQNVIMDPPFTKLDILVCRNLLIYLAPELQKKLLPLFHYSLNLGGILFLGSAETIGAYTGIFKPLDSKMRIYRRIDSSGKTEPVDFPSSFFPAMKETVEPSPDKKPLANLQMLADNLILSEYAPAVVMTSSSGDIIYISGRTGKYLEPAAGKANWNIFAMAREGLRYELTTAFQKAVLQNETFTLKDLQVFSGEGPAEQTVEIIIKPVDQPETLRGMVMIIFKDVAAARRTAAPGKPVKPSVRNVRLVEMENELKHARRELQSVREEMQTSQEELKSTNEELQSSNEELQSINEELTTSKEEMQSMNEELQTVNNELVAKVDELSRTGNDMKNLLDSTDIAILFLDEALNVRRFTKKTTQIIKLIPTDVGRPITDIASDIIYPGLAADAREVLRTLLPMEKTVSGGERWFLLNIVPYRTMENLIDGVVLTFTDITVSTRLEMTLRETQASLEKKVTRQKAELEKKG